jgi:hypothetical protein
MSGYKAEKSTDGGTWTQIYQGTATSTTDTVAFGTTNVAYRVKAYDSEGAESAYQTSATRTVVNNVAPTTPSSLTVPANVVGDASLTVSWGASTDSDGNLSGYRLERSVNGAAYAQIYQGSNLFYADTITKGWNTVAYQVKAYDSAGAESAYVQSPTRTVDNTSPPAIGSTTSGDLGTKSDGFTWQYTVTQPDSSATTVVESMDGIAMRSYTATLGSANTFDVTGTFFQGLSNGAHAMQVTATSGGKSASYTVTFTKAVYALNITLETPLPADGPITKMVMNITRSVPADATFQVLVTNNANDASPVWEDVTQNVKNGTNYLFTNTTLVNAPAFNLKITASRGASNLGGFISSIGGAFE